MIEIANGSVNILTTDDFGNEVRTYIFNFGHIDWFNAGY